MKATLKKDIIKKTEIIKATLYGVILSAVLLCQVGYKLGAMLYYVFN